MMRSSLFKKIFIRHSFFWQILLVAVLPLIVMSLLSIRIAENILINQVAQNLSLIANNKINNIENFIQDSKKDASLLASIPTIYSNIKTLEVLLKNGNKNNDIYANATRELQSFT